MINDGWMLVTTAGTKSLHGGLAVEVDSTRFFLQVEIPHEMSPSCLLLASTLTTTITTTSRSCAVNAFITPISTTPRIQIVPPSSRILTTSHYLYSVTDDGDDSSSSAIGGVSTGGSSSTAIINDATSAANPSTAAIRPSTTVGSNDERELEEPMRRRRTLGSQELLMLPRQYGPRLDNDKDDETHLFPSMSHVQVTIVSSTPSIATLARVIDLAMETHPLLRSVVEGAGEPSERIDLFQMVRRGDPDPCSFVDNMTDGCFTSKDVLRVVDIIRSDNDVDDDALLTRSWKENFATDIDDGSWYKRRYQPMWKMTLHRLLNSESSSSDSNGEEMRTTPCALVFSSNHAISDQSSVNMLMDQLLADIVAIEKDGYVSNVAVMQNMPLSVEDSVLGVGQRFSDIGMDGFSTKTISYVAGKATEGFRNPVILPDNGAIVGGGDGISGAFATIMGKSAGGEDNYSSERRTALQFRNLSVDATSTVLEACRASDVSVTHALTAAMALTVTDLIDRGDVKRGRSRNYKVLQSLDMRRFGAQLDKCETVACMAGSNDLMFGPLPDHSGESIRLDPKSSDSQKQFWDLARDGRDQTNQFFESDGPANAVRVFDFAMTISDMNNLVDLSAKSKDSLGRAYSAGVANNGVYERQKAVKRENEKESGSIKSKHGKYEIKDVYFGTPHSRSGSLYQLSTITVNGSMKLTFMAASPIISDEELADFADAFIDLLENVTKYSTRKSFLSKLSIPEGSLTVPTAALGVVGVAIHAGAWSEFFSNIATMKENIQNPQEFWDALNFWIFFAVAHPLLQPILWISDVLHGSPGPMILDLVPASFLGANLLFIGASYWSKEFRGALNVAVLSAFLTYVGAGLDGQAGLGDYNLQLDDSYQGDIVRGCPAYDDVRRPSMEGFDLEKYQGKWYEQKFHDWTQFKEVYDTTIDIKLTSDKKGWIDDFGVRGPSPESAQLSWDKSPVANGAHYFMPGRVDENDPPGVLREKGFGVEFPNYIVDVQKDPVTGEYTEAIQFQCLERGGVRVFEGINFMSRKPVMTYAELKAMHARAAAAGMNKYGASEEQMHTVARRGENEHPIDNNWQRMWHAIGVDSLLELLAESIEDGGR